MTSSLRTALRLASALGLALSAACSSKPTQQLVVFHTNGIEGRISARSDKASGTAAGGFAALAHAVTSETRPHLLLDAGNWFHGTPEGILSKGQAVIELMNAAGYDASTLGSHDFMFDQSNLKKLVEGASFPVLAANVYDAKSGSRPAYLKAGLVKDVGGFKVGVFGLASRRVPLETLPSEVAGLDFRRELDEANTQAAELRKQGATIVIALSHVGLEPWGETSFEGDRFLAAQAEGVDAIVGSKCRADTANPWRDPAKGTIVVCAPGSLQKAGRLVLKVDPATGKLAGAEEDVVDLPAAGQDEKVQKIAEKWISETAKEMNEDVADARESLGNSRFAESALGDWVADCMRSTTKAQAAFLNSGALRSDLAVGKVTRRALFEAMPFEDELVTVSVSGSKIRQALERGYSGDRGVLQLSGVKATLDPTALPGGRVGNVSIEGKPLDPGQLYTIAVTGFLSGGGDGFLEFQEGGPEGDGKLLRDALTACAKKEKTLAPPALGRVSVGSL
jgi:5'-nucleotidase